MQLSNSVLKSQPAQPCSSAVLTHLHGICRGLLPTFVHAHGHLNGLRAVLVAYKDAVFSRVFHADVVDSYGAALGIFGDGEVVLVDELPVVTKPEALWCRVAFDEACQTQRLMGE